MIKGSARFKGAERLPVRRQKKTLTDQVLLLIEHGIDQLKAKIRHADLIAVGIEEGNGNPSRPLLQVAAFFIRQ